MNHKNKALANYIGGHPHRHNKKGLLGAIEGLQNTKDFGIKKGERAERKRRAKLQAEDIF